MHPTTRLTRRVRADFEPDEAELVLAMLADLPGLPGPAVGERVQAAVVKLAGGDLTRLEVQLQAARTDWRDVLVAAGLANEDWAVRLDAFLGPAGAGR